MNVVKNIAIMVGVCVIEGILFSAIQAAEGNPSNLLSVKPPASSRPTEQVPPDLRLAFARAMSADAPIEYQMAPTSDGYQAANPGQGFVGHFMPDGVQIRQPDGANVWSMTLTGIGYETVQPVSAAMLWVEGTRAEYRRGTALTEWYLNSPLGLEQGLTLQTPPAGRDGITPLRVEFVLTGSTGFDGQTLQFRTADGQTVLHYSGLLAWDADRQALSVQMILEGQTLRWVVQDQGARYPLTIDPWVQQKKLTASDGTADVSFGCSVAVSGETAVIGALYTDIDGQNNQGAAYVFVRNNSIWTEQQKLIANDGVAWDRFGDSVAISEDTIVIGAPYAAISGRAAQGAAYVFVRSGGVWTQQPKLIASDGVAYDEFGSSVAISGDTAVIGVPFASVGDRNNQGTAYVFARNSVIWIEQRKLTASDGVAEDRFGDSVAVSGDTVVIGAPYAVLGGESEQGAAYVFVSNGGTWTEQHKLTAGDGNAGDRFGESVALSGNSAVVGASRAAGNQSSSQGAAYVFVRSSIVWTEQQKLTADDGAIMDEFGEDVALSGDTAVIGARYATVSGQTYQGVAYVFARSGSVWTQQQKLIASDGAEDNYFGGSVALSGDTVVVGASGKEAAYVFVLGNAYLLWTK